MIFNEQIIENPRIMLMPSGQRDWTAFVRELAAAFPLGWDDLRFPAQGINPAGPGNQPTVEADSSYLLFATNQDNNVVISAQMPHSWREGTAIQPHVHWSKTTSAAGGVAWVLDYFIYPINGGDSFNPNLSAHTSLGASTTTVSATPDTDTANRHLITDLGEIDMTGQTVSCMLHFLLYRDVSDAADNYAADARMLEFDLHYQRDYSGSREEFTK